MLCAVDTETLGLNAKAFLTGGMKQERKQGCDVFREPERMWEAIIKLGEAERERGKNLYVYAHYHQYDWYAYAQMDNETTIMSFNPFIARRRNIWFLDSYAIARMPLAKAAKLIGMEKMDMPHRAMEGRSLEDVREDTELIAKISQYMQNDIEITYNYLMKVKEMLKTDGIKTKRLISMGQLGLSYLMREIGKEPHLASAIIGDERLNQAYESQNKYIIQRAYRGAMVKLGKTGAFEGVSAVDRNSLYPEAASKIDIPYLASEEYEEKARSSIEGCFGKVGVARCLLKKPADRGFLGIRGDNELVFPKQTALLSGTWTLLELEEAVKRGYEILQTYELLFYEYSIKKGLERPMKRLYSLRKRDEMSSKFYKMMLTNLIGKLAQHREAFELKMETMHKKEVMEGQGYEFQAIMEDMGLFRKSNGEFYSKLYIPIIPAYTTAQARTTMQKEIEKIPEEDHLYTDTDSIIFKGDHLSKFKVGQEMGQWKITAKDTKAMFYAKKTYKIGEDIKISGIPESFISMAGFDAGLIRYKEMKTLRTDASQAGLFEDAVRDLMQSMYKHQEKEEELAGKKIIVDAKEKDGDMTKDAIEAFGRGVIQ